MTKTLKVEIKHLRPIPANTVVELTEVQIRALAAKTEKEVLEKAALKKDGKMPETDDEVFTEWR